MPIDVTLDGHVATVTINRPEKKNAITRAMRGEIQARFEKLQDDLDVRAIVLAGAGEDFSAGADVSEGDGGEGGGSFGTLSRVQSLHRMMHAVASTQKPVIAAVRGVCIGLGWSLALASDFVVAAEDARFRFAYRNIGIPPDAGAAFLLTRHVGLMRAKELIYSGRFVDGKEALRLGLALEALPSGDVMARAQEMAAAYARGPTAALSLAKRQFNEVCAQDLDQAMAFEAAMLALAVTTEDFREAGAALMERRTPDFRGR